MNWETIGVSVILSLSSSIIVAYLTMKFALSRFYREKWWERTADNYVQLTGSLYKYKDNIKKLTDDYFEDQKKSNHAFNLDASSPLSDEEVQSINKENKQVLEEVNRLSELGPLVLTQTAADNLLIFIDSIKEAENYYAYHNVSIDIIYSMMSDSAEKVFCEIMVEAKKELKIASFWSDIENSHDGYYLDSFNRKKQIQ